METGGKDMEFLKNAKMKDIAIIGVAGAVGLSIVAGAVINVVPSTSVSVGGVTAEAISNPAKETTPIKNVPTKREFSQQASPFGNLPKAGPESANASTSAAAVARFDKPPISSSQQMKFPMNSPVITPPSQNGSFSEPTVTGVIIARSGSGHIAVLADGEKQQSVKEGSKTLWGKVTKITDQGIYIGERFIALSKGTK